MTLASVSGYSAFSCGHLGYAYNEAAFRHFLSLDYRRAERSTRSLLLILVRGRMRGGARPTLARGDAARVFQALGSCVREVDFAGWYREGQVAGAVVSLAAGVAPDVSQRLEDRLSRVLEMECGPDRVTRLRVTLVRVNRLKVKGGD